MAIDHVYREHEEHDHAIWYYQEALVNAGTCWPFHGASVLY